LNIFLSWSGKDSKNCALALREWLPKLFPTAAPWMSQEDIRKGKPWTEELKQAIAQAKFSIICINPSNINKQWILYEAGALAYAMDDPYVATFLVALTPKDVSDGPLAIFQHTVCTKDDVKRLAHTINDVLTADSYEDHELDNRFEGLWPSLMNTLSPIAASFGKNKSTAENTPSARDSETGTLPRNAERILRTLAEQPHLPMGALQLSSHVDMHQTRAIVSLKQLLSHEYVSVDGRTIGGDAYLITEKGHQYLVKYNLV
jgi:hypothetical protein